MNRQHAFERMRAPADEVLAVHGIRTRKTKRGAAIWFNMERCPACGHKGYQCGVSESIGRNGRLVHGVHCFHPQENPWNKENVHYADFLAHLGVISADEAEAVKNFEKYEKPKGKNLFNINSGIKFRNRLFKNRAALAYLHGRGLDDKTIERFFLGLSAEWKNKDTGERRSDALLCPLRGLEGRLLNRYVYYNIPGVSVNPLSDNGWMKGDVATFYADAIADQRTLFICEGLKDVWRHWQELSQHDRTSNLLLVSSTHGTAFPNEWKEPEFWQRWDVVYCGQDNDEAGQDMVRRIALLAGREVRRALVPKTFGKDWTDFWQQGGTIEEFEEILNNAPVMSQEISSTEETGRVSFDPIDINGAFHNGYLYYPVQTLYRETEKRLDPSGAVIEEVVESLETVVIRSDRTVHTAVSSRPRKGASKNQVVWRLTDGTLIETPPRPNTYGTWSWGAIDDYLNKRNKTRSLGKMLRAIYKHLYANVWLPYPEDYAVLALTVPVTYAQAAFDAVPLFIVNGPAGSGKSQLGIAMSQVCANGSVIGQTSAASIARYIDETRGFVVLDDLESLGTKGNGGKEANSFSELAQALKLSYNKSTGIKLWTDVKTMKTEKLNFFGVKFINNTQGVDDILGSRMLHIQTRTMPPEVRAEFHERQSLSAAKLRALRDELHTWAFENIGHVVKTYADMVPGKSDRAEEITAPLKVIAAMAGDAELEADFKTAIAMQRRKVIRSEDPVEVLWEALRNLVIQGFAWVMPNHLVNEMKTMIPKVYDQQSTTQIPEWHRASWIGRQLRVFDLVDPNIQGKRYRVRGGHLRAFPIHPRVLKEVREWAVEQDVEIKPTGSAAPESFCQDCATCVYCGAGCDMMHNDDARMTKTERLAAHMNHVRTSKKRII
ncbi:DUF3631 domain-containing protein [Desulfovibrio inopinatus]|uniref:DUF3631 domain-containing protein n=1 Tax=Desulfovibrio inopinatus TaxID=102109 RepID=UPI0003FADF11|nr:DUF3631 domain-containing protein [Desulfovibrio inopinatus]